MPSTASSSCRPAPTSRPSNASSFSRWRSGWRPTWPARRSRHSRTTTCSPASFGTNIGVRPLDPDNIDELGKLINEEILVGFPDTQSFAAQGNLFGGFGDGRNIDFQLQATDFPALLAAARSAEKLIQEKMPGAQVQAFQGLEMAEPELRLNPDDRRLNEVGWSRGDIGTVVRALGDGMFVGEYFDGERRLDMILRASKWDSPEALAETPVATPFGNVMPLGELVRVESTVGAGGLRRVDGHRTIGLNVSPPKELSLGQAIEVLKRDVEPVVRAHSRPTARCTTRATPARCAKPCRTWRRTSRLR